MTNNKEETLFGEVVWFDPKRGFGFIKKDNQKEDEKDMFVHFSDINSEGFKTLHKGQKVSYSVGNNKNGVPKAVNVITLKN